ncbi:uncharacterized protein OCT59_017409 [Rhizophagus irregularis]|uniref:uncharacterized protein n=1 Tax=Rhizophagus irregularis TaxID=588596 RepID=UPI003329D768|nr:hypothetical protein OCT59_017409 [Rhizophagus irregularis]
MQSSLFNDTSESDISDLKNSVRDFKRNHHMNSNIKNYTCEKNDLCTDDEIESVSTEVQKFITKMSKLKHRLLNFSERNQIFTVNKIFTDDERKTMRKFWEIGEPSDEEKPTRHESFNTLRFFVVYCHLQCHLISFLIQMRRRLRAGLKSNSNWMRLLTTRRTRVAKANEFLNLERLCGNNIKTRRKS